MSDEHHRPVARETALTVHIDRASQDTSLHCAARLHLHGQLADLARAVKLRAWESEIPSSLQSLAVRQNRPASHSLFATECALQQVRLRR